ncbi:hypothetical protein KAR28_01410 [Candidatus Parcubacteria bacterium]|nr:hypothetical protein [Candidatus Parcubacteria bacterium]
MKINKNKIRKIITISIVMAILSLLSFVNFKASHLEEINPLFYWIIPLVSGVAMVFIQKENRSLAIIPSLASG